jgi:hypothetical protein
VREALLATRRGVCSGQGSFLGLAGQACPDVEAIFHVGAVHGRTVPQRRRGVCFAAIWQGAKLMPGERSVLDCDSE